MNTSTLRLAARVVVEEMRLSANRQFLNSSGDLSWLRDMLDIRLPLFKSAIIEGNEDSPSKVYLYSDKNPDHTDVPIKVLVPDKDSIGYKEVRR